MNIQEKIALINSLAIEMSASKNIDITVTYNGVRDEFTCEIWIEARALYFAHQFKAWLHDADASDKLSEAIDGLQELKRTGIIERVAS